MRESIIQTTINKFLTWLAKKSVTVLYRRTQFWTFSWGLDENTDLYLMSEESYPDYHRFGVREERKADTPQTETKRVGYCNECKWFRDKQVCGRCRSKNLFAKADTPQTDSEKPNNCEHITEDGVTCARYPACDDCPDNPLNKVKGSERLVKGSERSE